MISVKEAENIVLAEAKSFGEELIHFREIVGRVLSQPVFADRAFPPFDRVSMDGIAIDFNSFASGQRSFHIERVHAAGDSAVTLSNAQNCIEVMTGAVCPLGCDTVIRYEDLEINGDVAIIQIDDVRQTQNVHPKGSDKQPGDILIKPNCIIQAEHVALIATVGMTNIPVYTLPKVVLVSNGDELVEINETPTPHQIRKSNVHAIRALLEQWKIQPEMRHFKDDAEQIENQLKQLFVANDVLILSGGVSMGKFDFIAPALEKIGVKMLFHKVQQRPGKPFWFGKHSNGTLVFAFPGNPVSTHMCALRYFIPWLRQSVSLHPSNEIEAILADDFQFKPPLHYFLQSKICFQNGQVVATPIAGHGSGDLANLSAVDGFLELPADRISFDKGEIFPFWPLNSTI
jgi:molybdopterin molybdotransferase